MPSDDCPANGLKAWAQVLERGFAGLVAKDEASRYAPGRTLVWLKVKRKDWTVREDRWRRRLFEPEPAPTLSRSP